MGEETETRESQETGSVMHSLDHCGLCLRKRQPGGGGGVGARLVRVWNGISGGVSSLVL